MNQNIKSILLISLVSFFLHNCAPTGNFVEPMEEKYLVEGFDFSEYTKKGFMFTPEKYSGQYESVGVIEVEYIPEFRQIESGSGIDTENYRIYSDPRKGTGSQFDIFWAVSISDNKKIISEAYEIATNMGANAIVNFRIISSKYNNGGLEVNTIKLTGFAIERTD